MIVCPQCGYERTNNDDDFVCSEVCPKCGIFYSKWKQPLISKGIEPAVLRENKRYSYQEVMLKGSCFISIYCIIVLFVLPLLGKIFLGGFFIGNDGLFLVLLWGCFFILACFLSLIAVVGGIIFLVIEIRRETIKNKQENQDNSILEIYGSKRYLKVQEDSGLLNMLSMLCCFLPIVLILVFFICTTSPSLKNF